MFPLRFWQGSTPLPKSRSRTPLWATWPLESLCRSCSTCATQRPRIPQQNTPGVPGTSVKVGSVCLASPLPFYPALSPLLSRGSAIDEVPGYSCLDFCRGASKISGLGCSGENWKDFVMGTEWCDKALTVSLPAILFSLQPGQRSVVIRQLRQPGTMCTEQPIASYDWHWMAASACVFIPRATVNRKVREPEFLCYNIGKRVWALWPHRMRVRPGSCTCQLALCY